MDTTFLVARFNLGDAHHRDALSLLRDLAGGKAGAFRLVITDYVFDEMVTAILARTARHGLAAAAGRSILGSKAWRVEILGRQDFERGWTLFLERKDKRWSFTDCTSFALMDVVLLDDVDRESELAVGRPQLGCPEQALTLPVLRLH